MGECNIDHPLEDVTQKLESQKNHLPDSLYKKGHMLLQANPTQDVLNVLFHLLKKYDLLTAEEQQERNEKLSLLLDTQL
ncbi:group-specific protein [Aquibacillus albus]|uniref:Group-specific protein n=1 Tax=Aquibacillus albus TaxID=1168171 RepID=A0ABS2N3D3_9BACI|nr:group-specific protein [Aquibacillus albus]MBM7572650.1 hypothetical protein [Aquibacillus albus]